MGDLVVVVEGDTLSEGVRTLALRLSSPRGAAEMRVRVDAPGEIVSATLDGRPLDLKEYDEARDGLLQLSYINIPEDGFELTLAVRSADPRPERTRITVEDSSTDLPEIRGLTVQPRPPDMMPAPLYRRDATEVVKVVRV